MTAPLIKRAAIAQMMAEWNFKSEALLRMRMTGDLIDEVNAEFESIGLGQIAIWTIFARGPLGKQNIHVDAASEKMRVHSAVIIPVMGAEGSKMQWFDEGGMTLVNVPNADGKSTLFRKSSPGIPPLLEELQIDSPIIARVDVPHRAVASKEPRAVVSIKLMGNPELL